MTWPAATDEAIVQAMAAARAGDRAAHEAALVRCVPLVQTIARAERLPGVNVDDLVQETLLSLHTTRDVFDPARPLRPWLRTIVRRRAIDMYRRAKRRPTETIDEGVVAGTADPAFDAFWGDPSWIDAPWRRAVLREAIDGLTPRQREAVEHLGLAQRSLNEAAAMTGLTPTALKVNFHRALKTLRARLHPRLMRAEL